MRNETAGETPLFPPASRLARARPFLCRCVPAAAVLCFLSWSFISVRPDFSWDDADPEVLNQAWRLANGESIYRGVDVPPYTFAAYPPLYFALTAGLLKFTGLSFLPARLLSFLAALFIGWALVRLNREWNKTGQGGVWAAFLLFLIPAFLYNSTRSNVQMMAVALSVWSLVFFLRNRWQETLILSPLLAVLAIYTKQTQFALPLAMAVYLAIRNRRWLFPYVAVVAAAGMSPFLWLQKITGGYFFLDTIRLANLSYNLSQIPQIFIHHAGPGLLFICLALLLALKRFRNGTWEPVDCYLGCVLATTLFSLGRIGAHGQYVLELLVVALLVLLRVTGLPAIKGRDALVSIQILVLFLYAPLFVFLEEGLWDIPANRAAAKIYPVLKTQPGPILSQQGSFALFGRGEIFIQLFHFTALSRAGLWDQNRLVREIEQRTFSFVVTEFPIEQPALSENAWERFTPEMIRALGENYQRMKVFHPYYLYAPRLPIAEYGTKTRHRGAGEMESAPLR
jgi:hypothetical protein